MELVYYWFFWCSMTYLSIGVICGIVATLTEHINLKDAPLVALGWGYVAFLVCGEFFGSYYDFRFSHEGKTRYKNTVDHAKKLYLLYGEDGADFEKLSEADRSKQYSMVSKETIYELNGQFVGLVKDNKFTKKFYKIMEK